VSTLGRKRRRFDITSTPRGEKERERERFDKTSMLGREREGHLT